MNNVVLFTRDWLKIIFKIYINVFNFLNIRFSKWFIKLQLEFLENYLNEILLGQWLEDSVKIQ